MLDQSKLIGIKRYPQKIVAQCPVCMDSKKMHLAVYPNGAFNCIKFANDKQHNKEIFALVGLKDKTNQSQETPKQEEIQQDKIFPKDILNKLICNYEYFEKRGVSVEVMKEFQAGLALGGSLGCRFVWPIFDKKMNIIGLAGRAVIDSKRPPWKLLGRKSKWLFPWHLAEKHIKAANQVILIEGISDGAYLFTHGIRNVMCLFGTEISKTLIAYLISLGSIEIIIATNNEPDNNNIGNNAAEKIKEKLLTFFDESKIRIKLPLKKDFALMTGEEVKEWQKGLCNIVQRQ